MRFRKLKKKLATFGIGWDKSVGKGSHGAFVGLGRITKVKQVYPLPKKQQTEVSPSISSPFVAGLS